MKAFSRSIRCELDSCTNAPCHRQFQLAMASKRGLPLPPLVVGLQESRSLPTSMLFILPVTAGKDLPSTSDAFGQENCVWEH